ncbi:MAG: hypothetical protein ACXW5U_04975 [Thermoanaerobaculia bacterium]
MIRPWRISTMREARLAQELWTTGRTLVIITHDPAGGLAPATSGVTGRRSNRLNYYDVGRKFYRLSYKARAQGWSKVAMLSRAHEMATTAAIACSYVRCAEHQPDGADSDAALRVVRGRR